MAQYRLHAIWSAADLERKQPTPPDLSCVDGFFIEDALKKWERGREDYILAVMMSNEIELNFVVDNMHRLIARGTYEKCLLSAYISTRTNHSHWHKKNLEMLFMLANKQKLLMAGNKLPDSNEFILYRGVSGTGHKRRIRGISWTSDIDRAKWFANRMAELFGNPGCYNINVKRNHILAYCNERNENEFLIIPKPHMKILQVL